MDYVTAKELANMLGVSTKTVKRRIQAGQIEGQLRQGSHGSEYCVSFKEVARVTGNTDILKEFTTLDTGTNDQVANSKDIEIIPAAHAKALQVMIDTLMETKYQNEVLQGKLDSIELKLDKIIDKEKQPWWKRLFKG